MSFAYPLESPPLFLQARDAEEEATPKLFEFNASRSSDRAVVSRDEFFQQFNVRTIVSQVPIVTKDGWMEGMACSRVLVFPPESTNTQEVIFLYTSY